jgi:hypothetical protein
VKCACIYRASTSIPKLENWVEEFWCFVILVLIKLSILYKRVDQL